MPALILLILFLPWSVHLCGDENGEETSKLIQAYRELPADAVAERKSLLDQLHALATDDAAQFVAREMEKARHAEIRAHAFFLRAADLPGSVITAYLDSRKSRPGFRALIPVLPNLPDFDSLSYLIKLYDEEGFGHFRNDAASALVALDRSEAFAFLEEKWKACKDTKEGLMLLAALSSCTRGQSSAFLLGLLDSRHAFARVQGMRRLIEKEGEAAVIRSARFLGVESHPAVRKGVLEALAATGRADAAGVIARASSSHPPESLHQIVEILGSMPLDAVQAAFPEDLGLESDPLLFKVGALAISNRNQRDAVKAIKRGERNDDPTVRFIAAVALHRLEKRGNKVRRFLTQGRLDLLWDIYHAVQCFRIRDPEVVDRIVAALGARSWELRIKAAQVAAAFELEAALSQLEKNLSSKRLLVRISVYKALALIRTRECVPLMLARLSKEEGRAAWEINRSLKTITGRDFGIDSKRWNSWWKAEGAGFVPRERKIEGDAVWLEGETSKGRYSFYGLPFDSHNISFVIDLSSSMGVESHSGLLKDAPITKLRRELTASIEMLTKEHFMNVICFNTLVTQWKEGLVSLDDKKGGYKAEALILARYLRTRGGTNLHGGLMKAMDDEEVDAILLLSDGDPTEGAVIDKDAIVEAVALRNRVMQAVVHVVGIGRADRAFLKELATSTGGTFRSL